MSGCFGNHPVDRWIENDLFRHLEDEDRYETLCEAILSLIPDDLYDKWDFKVDKLLDQLAMKIERNVITLETAQIIVYKIVMKYEKMED